MTDPYKVLGVSPDASDDDIKKAYRDLARKYHPDKYRDSDLADLASEKMKEVNAAYEEIQKIRASGGSRSNNGYNSQSYAGNTSSNPKYAEVRRLINNGNDVQAENILDAVHEGDRNAEWHFLKGCVAARRGFYVDAQRYFDVACSMDPYNNEYRAAQNNLRMRAGGYGYGGGYNTSAGGCSMCDLCAGLMCLDCLCDCI